MSAALDVIIRGGTVVDGTSGAAVQADVGIRGDSIEVVGSLPDAHAPREIDARGLHVVPGFIDIHSHSDLTLLLDGQSESALSQGVTTELVGNCGHGCAPMDDDPRFSANIFGHTSAATLDWRTVTEYLDRLEQADTAVNVGTLVPLGNLRLSTMDDPERQSTPNEQGEMARMLEAGLDSGAWGLSSGLQYPDSLHTGQQELETLARLAGERGRLYSACVRHTDEKAVVGMMEAVDTGVRASVRTQVSHAMPQPGSPHDMRERTFELVEAANRRGGSIAFDMHTRTFGELNLSAALPVWAINADAQTLIRYLSAPDTRAQIKQYTSILQRFLRAPGPDQMFVDNTTDRDLVGRSLAELAGPKADPIDVVLDILVSEAADIHRPLCTIALYKEDDMAEFYKHPLCSIASDATTLTRDGPLGDTVFHGAFTWAAWFLRRMVRERNVLTVEDAIRRMTSLPAERIGLRDRGTLRVGAKADITMIRMDQVSDRGTFAEPNLPAVGIRHVTVNGRLAIDNGTLTGARPGRVLRAE